KKRELIEARNQADGLIYTTEKAVKEHGDKVDEATRKGIETALDEVKKAMEGDDIEAIRQKTEVLATASHKLAEVMYQQAQAGAEGTEGGEAPGGKQDDVVDAEFEEVDDKKK
ncbi:MAG: Hsp70 family protein, partial [Desulfuromonadales bacterium]